MAGCATPPIIGTKFCVDSMKIESPDLSERFAPVFPKTNSSYRSIDLVS